MTSPKRKSVLGSNPLAIAPAGKGIFQKTETGNQQDTAQPIEAAERPAEIQKPDSRKKNPESRFLAEDVELEKVTLRLSIELNDWLDDLLKQGKRNHGQKIPKEVWVQAALELFKAMPIDWTEVKSVEEMREKLNFLESGFRNLESGK